MDVDRIVRELEQERDRITKVIASLKGLSATTRKIAVGNGTSRVQRRGGMSAAGRKRLSALMKKRWAQRKKKAAKSS